MKNDLLYGLLKIFGKKIVGNEDVLLVLLNKLFLRLVLNSDAVSSNLIVGGLTGVGKDAVVDTVCSLTVPDDCYFHETYLTDKVLIYWQIDWNGKVLYLEDLSAESRENPVLKVMASGGSHAMVCIGQEAVSVDIEGKPVIVITSMEGSVTVEMARRFDILNIDYDAILVKEVLRSIARESSLSYSVDEKGILKRIKDLNPIRVRIPFESKLSDVFPNNLLIPTLFRKFLDYIRASAVLHGRKVASWYDYEFARFVFWRLNSLNSVPLNVSEKEFVGILLDSAYHLKVSEVCARFTRGRKWVETHAERLRELGVIEIIEDFDKASNRDVTKYSSKAVGSFDLPSCTALGGSKVAYNEFRSLLKRLDADRIRLGLKPVFSAFLEK